MIRKTAFFWGGLSFLLLLSLSFSTVFWTGATVWLGKTIGWWFLAFFFFIALGAWIHGVYLLVMVEEPPVVLGYSVAKAIEELQEHSLFILNFFPLLGLLGVYWVLPHFFVHATKLANPLFPFLYYLIFVLIVVLFVWRGRAALWGASTLFLLIITGFFLSFFQRWPFPTWSDFWRHVIMSFAGNLLAWLYLAGLLRWRLHRHDVRPHLKVALILTTSLMVLGALLNFLFPQFSSLSFVSCALFGLFWFLWLGTSFAVIRALPIIIRKRKSLQFQGAYAFLYAVALPFAFFFALLGGGISGGIQFSFAISENSVYLMSFMLGQFFAFCGFSYISASYVEDTLFQSRIWLFFKPILIYLLLTLSFGFIGLSLLKNAKCLFISF